MTAPEPVSSSLPAKLFWLIMIAGLVPWFAVQTQLSLNGDITWLITAAERMVAGLPMVKNYYEVNPPLSILYNVPPVLLHKIVPFAPYHYVIIAYFLALIAAGTWLVRAILKHWDFLDDAQKRLYLAGFVIANTIIVTVSIGERDQIVILGLMPFVMAQMSLTWGYRLPRPLFWLSMVLGTVAILIKPHFGLLPVLVLAHRMVTQKRLFSIVRDPDFMILAIGTISYAAIVWFFFPDFVHVILPDVVALYLPNKSYEYAVPQLLWHLYMFVIFLGLEAAFSPLKGRQKLLLILLYAGALASLVPFAVQMKAYYYHLIPAIAFFFCAFALSLYTYADAYLKKVPYSGALVLIALFAIAYNNRPLMLAFPRHDDYKALPLTAEIEKCAEPCPVFMFNDNIEVMHPTFFYMGKRNASRFPSLWFLPQMIKHGDKPEMQAYRRKYADMIGEDLRDYHPKMLMIGQYWVVDNVEIFDFAKFFSESPLFAAEWSHYNKDRTITINRKPYFAGTQLGKDYPLTYDIYMRSR